MRKICIVTGTRSEWGLLRRIAELIRADAELELQLVATNMHLSERYGLTCREIEAAGFAIDRLVPMEAASDSPADTVRAMGAAMQGFADAYEALRPDVLLVLGDRYEILVAAVAATVFGIPVAHIHGGEVTQGAFDDQIRHALTKLSCLHFAATDDYRRRIVQMGERPETVHWVGAVGVDNIKHLELWGKEQTEASLGGFALDRNTVVATFHPATLDPGSPAEQIDALLGALDDLPTVRVVFTLPNSDPGNAAVAERIEQWCASNADRAVCFASLGQQRYFSTLRYVGAVVGNSSSGIIEVPSFSIPTVDIGIRQKGRTAAKSVVHCPPERVAIRAAIAEALRAPRTKVENPYERAATAQNIVHILRQAPLSAAKRFYDL